MYYVSGPEVTQGLHTYARNIDGAPVRLCQDIRRLLVYASNSVRASQQYST